MAKSIKQILKQFRFRRKALALADIGTIYVAALIANFVLTLLGDSVLGKDLVVFICTCMICTVAGLALSGAYSKLWRYFKSTDYLSCVYGTCGGFAAASVLYYILRDELPLRFVFLHALVSVVGVCLVRYLFKTTFIDGIRCATQPTKYRRTMIIGGGTACRLLIEEIRNAQASPYADDKISANYDPICIMDDDPDKIGKDVLGVQIVGSTKEIGKFVEQENIQQIVFCIPSALDEQRKRILELCSKTDLPVKVIPFLGNLLFDENHTTLLGQVRDINVEDLLGREPIHFDNKDIRQFIRGKVCMVTGGGGSIGSELVRQIAKYEPKQVIIVDIAENYAYDIQQELIMEYGDSLNLVTLIASVRDYYRMNQILGRYKPEVVFHAAAHKHVPLMEVSPMEAIKNNVFGTFNMATLAQFHNVKKFVMISTDKAVNPTNVMGASKRCCEMIVQYLAQQNEGQTEFVTTRFGNVLGSHGSVIPLFKKQIEQGRPVTVTHPDIIRYFMTIPEAVSLVMEAASIAHGGEIFVLDMGKPVRIVTLAENLIRMYGKVPYQDVKIEFTGLRPGEKIKEELLMNEEGLQQTSNKLIFIGKQIEIKPDAFIADLLKLRDAAQANDESRAVQALHNIVPTFITPEEFNKAELSKKALVAAS